MTTPTAAATRLPRKRVATGPARPHYLHSVENDRMVMLLTALAGEVSVLRDRLDTHEALAEQGLAATAEAIEAYAPTSERAARREAARLGMLKRVFRVYMEELDEIRQQAVGTSSAKRPADVVASAELDIRMPEGWDQA